MDVRGSNPALQHHAEPPAPPANESHFNHFNRMIPEKMTGGSTAARVALVLLLTPRSAIAGPIRDWFVERRLDRLEKEMSDDDPAAARAVPLPAGIRIVRDVAYGGDERQRFDVYSPVGAKGAPIILMVHGGAWCLGDKTAQAVVKNKVARWGPRGFVFVSTNYRLLPKAAPIEQARDVARALAAVQEDAASWGGDKTKVILMGHSAGAHLVALLATDPSISSGIVTTPWLGTVSLDSAALDAVAIMEARHFRFYDRAFGNDPGYWRAASPFFAVAGAGRPILLVCSTRRDDSCAQARRFASRAASFGMKASVLEEDFSHGDINRRLGEEPRYTGAVEQFMGGLDAAVAACLRSGCIP